MMQAHLCIGADSNPVVFTGTFTHPLSIKALTTQCNDTLHFKLICVWFSGSKGDVTCVSMGQYLEQSVLEKFSNH